MSHSESEIPWLSPPSGYSEDLTNSDEFALKKVCFGDISIREYPMILGDHPNARSGLPVMIDWHHQFEETMGLEMYQYLHKTTSQANSHSSGAKRVRARRLASKYRRDYLLSLDKYTTEDFVAVVEEMHRVQDSRMKNAGITDATLFKKILSEGQFGSGKVLRYGANFAVAGLAYTVNTAVDGTKAVANFGVNGTKAVANLGVNGTKAVANLGVNGTKAVANFGATGAKGLVSLGAAGGKGLMKVMTMPADVIRRRTSVAVDEDTKASAAAAAAAF